MSRRSWAFDVTLAVVVAAIGVNEALTGTMATHRQGPHWVEALAYCLAGLTLAFRRVRPLACLVAVCGVLTLEFLAVGSPEGYGVAVMPLIATYTVANREDRAKALWGLGVVVAFGIGWLLLDPMDDTWARRGSALMWISPWVAAWLLGAFLRARWLYVEGLVREREERALTAAADERARIARELHDVIGHSLSVMTVQASAVRRLMRADQEKERAALETVEATGREALAEMRRMVGVLRGTDAAPDLSPPPTLAQLEALAQTFRGAGLEVRVEVDGDAVPLPPGLDLTAYRLVQEALTNTLKHASASRAEVHVHYRPDALELSVRDDGSGPTSATVGTGLLGMRERVGVYGGELAAGAAAGGGYELRAELPLGAV